MIVLHVYTTVRPETQGGTWIFLAQARGKYRVVDRCTDGRTDYADFIRAYWGSDDMIVIEQDKEPAMADLRELASCGRPACCFPYPVSFWRDGHTPMSLWTERFPYGMGFVKFSREVQLAVPASEWYADGDRWYIDGRVEDAVMKRFGPMHLHERFIKHNHHPTKRQWVLALLRGH